MALKLRVLGAPEVGVIDAFEFYGGEDLTLKCQLIDSDKNCTIAIPDSAIKTLSLSGTPMDITIANTDINIDTDDKSIFTVDLSDTQTASMISGEIKLEYTASDVTRIATAQFGLKKLISSI